jgi:hypothetical protein
VADLEELLDAAAKASRQDRITWRNPIAEYGSRAIPIMRDWLTNPELGAFAVRVLEKIAEQPGDRHLVVDALDAVAPAAVSPVVAGDIARVRQHLSGAGSRRTVSIGSGSKPTNWSGYMAATPLEKRFHDAMLDVFRLAGEATRKERSDGTYQRGYWATYFLRGVRNHGGLAYAHQLLQADGTTDGFRRLTEEGRLDLTMEALVLRGEFRPLFSQHEIQVASSRLARAGYQPPGR